MVLGASLLAMALVAGLLVASHQGTAGPAPAAAGSQAELDAAAQGLLDRRASALMHHDRLAFEATQTADATAPAVARILALPWARYRYTGASATRTGAGELLVSATLVLQLVDDTAPATRTETLDLVQADDGWRVRSEDAVVGGVQLWDLGALDSYQGRHVLVVGVDVPVDQLRRYADTADAAVPAVDAVWGTGWPQHAVIVVPSSPTQLARGIGASMDALTDIAAYAVPDPGDPAGPLRVWINPAALSTLSDLGRSVVLRHELTHVATRSPATTTTPIWLDEGFAEFVGYRGSGIPLDIEIEDLLAVERRHGRVHPMPTYAELHDPATIAVAYESAALTCSLIAQRVGVAGLVRFFRLTAAGHGTRDANAAAALRTVTGWSVAAFDSSWRSHLAAMAG